MKLISVVIPPARFDAVKEALALFGVRGMTVGHVFRTSDRTGPVESYRGQQFTRDMEPNLKIDLLAPDDAVADLVRVISKIVARSDADGGTVWITDVNLVVRVRTSEHGLDALY